MSRAFIASIVGSASFLVMASGAGAQVFHRAIGFNSLEAAYSVESCSAATGAGFVTAGRSQPALAGLRDIYVVRTSNAGNDIWSRTIGLGNTDEVGYSVRQALDGGFIIAAETNQIPGIGMALVRLNAAGNMVWSRAYGGTPFFDFPSGTAVRELPDGTFSAIGRQRVGNFLQGRMIRVSNAAGVPIWGNNYRMLGLTADVSFTDLRTIPASSGGGAIAGYFVSGWILDYSTQQRSALIVRIDPAGNPVASWTYSLPGRSLTADGITLLGSNIIFSGRMTPSPTAIATNTIIVSVTQAAGVVSWARNESDFRNGFAALANDTGVVVAGTEPSSGDIAAVRLNAAGGLVFANSHAARGEGHDVIAVPGLGAGYVLTGFETIPVNNGFQDVALIKTDAFGNSGCLMSPKPGPTALTIQRTQRYMARTINLENVTMAVNVGVVDSGNVVKCFDDSAAGEPEGCRADWNQDSIADSQDFFDYLDAFFRGDADFNADLATNSQDLFDFLAAFFEGC